MFDYRCVRVLFRWCSVSGWGLSWFSLCCASSSFPSDHFGFYCSAYILLLGSVLGSLVPLMSVSVLIVFWVLCLLFSFTFLCLVFTDFFCCCVSFPVSLVYVAQSGLCSVSLHHYPSHHASGSWFSWTSWVFVPLGFSFLVHYFHRLSLKVRFEFSSLLGPQPHATEPDGKKNGPLQLL